MSKNFELLQQLGGEEELFRTSGTPADAAAVANPVSGHDSDEEIRQRVLQSSSLPDVFQTSEAPPYPIAPTGAKFGSGENGRNGTGIGKNNSLAEEFRTSRNPASAIGSTTAPFRTTAVREAQQKAQPSTAPPPASPRDGGTKASQVSPSSGPPSVREHKVQAQGSRPMFPALRWVDSIKSKAKTLRWKVQPRNNRLGVDLETIVREEGIKLAQRVFPGTSPDAPRMVLFSGLEGEAGCAAVCARLGEILAARAEGPVCIVDANFRSPSMHEYFGVENQKGLVDAAVEAGPIQSFAQPLPEPGLWLMPSGKAAPKLSFPAIAESLRVRMRELGDRFRYVVIHSGPLRQETSAMLLTRWTDGVVLVLEANSTRRDSAKKVKENLAAANVSVLGVVLNNRLFPIPDVIYRRL